MRKPAIAVAKKPSLRAGNRSDAPIEMVCLALGLALLVLGSRIVSVW
jgi:hypothetical protein